MSQRKLSILTFNVHGERDASIEQISQFISDIDADIVCLQEHFSCNELKLTAYVLMSIGYAESAEIKPDLPGYLSNAIYVKVELLKEQKTDVARSNILFQAESDKSVPRSACVIFIEGITIANIHQTGGCGDDFIYKDLKNTKANQILRLIHAFQPDIIVGDLNAEENEQNAREQMKTYRFYQTLSTKDRELFLEYYLSGHRILQSFGYEPIYQTDEVKPTSVFGGVPDWMYYKSDGAKKIEKIGFKKYKSIPSLSDHNAILAVFLITN